MTTLHLSSALLPAGWADDVRVVVQDGRIAAINAGVAAAAGDDCHAAGIPGVASLHSHAFQRAMAGLAEVRGSTTDTFWTWRETMYRFALGMTPDDAEAVATLLYTELLEAGFTRVGEFHYLHHDRDGRPYANPAEMGERIAAAASTTGIGLTLLPCFYAHGTFGGAAPHDGQRRFICSVDGYAELYERSRRCVGLLGGANIGIAPHSLRAVTPAELTAILPLAGGGPIHIHAAEQTREVDECVAWSGSRPVEWLLANADLDHRWCLIHATHMTERETASLARTGAVAGLCPVTEASLGDGTFPARAFLAANGRIGIGTDSNVLIGLTDELRQLEYGQRLQRQERNVLASPRFPSTGRALYEAARSGGAQALAQADAGLTPGASADIVTLDMTQPSLAGRKGDAILDGWIFAAAHGAVDCVWARGRQVVAGGRHRSRDRARKNFNTVVGRLMA